MQSQRWEWTHRHGVALLLASIVAVVLAGAGLAVVLALGNGGGAGENRSGIGTGDPTRDATGPGEPTGPGDATEAAGATAECVVGTWRVVEQEQRLSAGTLTLVGEGAVVEYRADGTGVTDYGDGTDFTVHGTILGLGNADAVVAGTVSHDYTLRDGTMQYHNIDSQATYTVDETVEIPFPLSNEPFEVHCDGDVLTFRVEGSFDSELHRING